MRSLLVAAPFVFEETLEPLGDLRWVGVFVGALTAPTAAISSFLFRAHGRVRGALLAGRGLIAQWSYTPEEWRSFVGEDTERESSSKWKLFAIVAFWCVLFGILFPILDNENGWWVAVIMGGLMAFIAILIAVTGAGRKRRQ